MTSVTNDWYTKQNAAVMSAVGILLMIAHHLFGFSDYLFPPAEWHTLVRVGGIEIERVAAAFGKICVSLFAFNSGYVAWKFCREYSTPASLFRRMSAFLLSYWIVLALFWLYALLIGDPIPSGMDMFMNLVGLHTGPYESFVNVTFAWYTAYYLTFLLLVPLLLRLLSGPLLTDVAVVCLTALVLKYCIKADFMGPLMIGIEGMLVAKYGLFDRMARRLPRLSLKVLLLLEAVLVVARQAYLYCHVQILDILGGGRFGGCAALYIFHNQSVPTIKIFSCRTFCHVYCDI